MTTKYLQKKRTLWWEAQSFPVKIRYKARLSPLITPFHHHTASLCLSNKPRKGKMRYKIAKEDTELCFQMMWPSM